MKNILVVGAGSIGQRHIKNLLGQNKVFCYDKKEFKLDHKNFKLIHSLKNLDFLDFIIISTPTNTHLKYAYKLLNYNKPILIEKPLTHKFNQIEFFIKECKRNNEKIFISSNMRYHIGPKTIMENVNKIGKIFFCNIKFGNYLPLMRPQIDYREVYASKKSQGGGVFLDSIHEIDYAYWILGKFKLINYVKKKISNLEINVEDFVNLNLISHQRVQINIQLDYLRKIKKRGMEIVGEKGTLEWESTGKEKEENKIWFYDSIQKRKKLLYKTINYKKNQPYIDMINDFLLNFNKKNNLATLEDYKFYKTIYERIL